MSHEQTREFDDFAERARARVHELYRRATELTDELGLPPEAKGTVLAALHDPRTAVAAPEDAPARLFELVDGFLRLHLRDRLQEFAALWEVMTSAAREDFGRIADPQHASLSGLAFASGDEDLAQILAVVAWALSARPSEEAILIEAERRGLSRARRHALTAYLTSNLQDH